MIGRRQTAWGRGAVSFGAWIALAATATFALGLTPVAGMAYAGSSPAATATNATPTVFSESSGISTGPTTTTTSMTVAAGSAVFVFVGFVNFAIGGGSVKSVHDSLGDAFHGIRSTGLAENHTEKAFWTNNVSASTSYTVTVTFSSPNTEGGSVAIVDVTGQAAKHTIATSAENSGISKHALVALYDGHPHNLYLLGVSGRQMAFPWAAVGHETMLSTGNATTGPFTDGESFATFSSANAPGAVALAATLNRSSVWAAVGLAVMP